MDLVKLLYYSSFVKIGELECLSLACANVLLFYYLQ